MVCLLSIRIPADWYPISQLRAWTGDLDGPLYVVEAGRACACACGCVCVWGGVCVGVCGCVLVSVLVIIFHILLDEF